MDTREISSILKDFKAGKIHLKDVIAKLKVLPFKEIASASLDTHRTLRMDIPEVIYGESKNITQLKKIVKTMLSSHQKVIVTRCNQEKAKSLRKSFPSLLYDVDARILFSQSKGKKTKSYVSIVTAGASDYPVAREAQLTCELNGVRTILVTDVGVAGIHRLSPYIKDIQSSCCAIVLAGMEGALPGVVGGMCGIPVIGVPVSAGYGVAEGGFVALLSMLSSCTPNVSVVNIDNGFGAGVVASLIAKKIG